MKTFFLILIIMIILVIGIILYDTNHFVVRRYQIKDKRIGGNPENPIRLVFLSDLHGKEFGYLNSSLLRTIEKLSPEAILIGGDMVTANRRYRVDTAINLCKNLSKEYPVYYADGNHEYRLTLYPEIYRDMSKRLEKGLRKANVKRINDKTVELKGKSGDMLNISVSGLKIEREYYKRFNPKPMEDDYVLKHLGKCDPNTFHIVLAHDSELFYAYKHYKGALFLSGHVHGGIARIPFIGGVLSPRFHLFPKYDGGKFKESGVTMIVSRGLGYHTIPVRFLNPCEVVLLELSQE